jgi:hypothetical protein
MNKKLDLKNFDLHKVSFNAKKGLVIDFYDINTPNDLWNVDSDSQPHEDYQKALDALKEVFAYSIGLNNGWEFARENNRKNDEALRKSIQSWKDEIEKFTIKSMTTVGFGDSKGIKIAGSIKTDLGVSVLSSPIVRFDDYVTNSIDEDVMIGDLAETAFNKIQEEVWGFIFKSKRGGELFSSEQIESGLNGVPKMMKVG